MSSNKKKKTHIQIKKLKFIIEQIEKTGEKDKLNKLLKDLKLLTSKLKE